jgi:hypothetical protein
MNFFYRILPRFLSDVFDALAAPLPWGGPFRFLLRLSYFFIEVSWTKVDLKAGFRKGATGHEWADPGAWIAA